MPPTRQFILKNRPYPKNIGEGRPEPKNIEPAYQIIWYPCCTKIRTSLPNHLLPLLHKKYWTSLPNHLVSLLHKKYWTRLPNHLVALLHKNMMQLTPKILGLRLLPGPKILGWSTKSFGTPAAQKYGPAYQIIWYPCYTKILFRPTKSFGTPAAQKYGPAYQIIWYPCCTKILGPPTKSFGTPVAQKYCADHPIFLGSSFMRRGA